MSKVEKIRKEIERLKAETFDNKELSLEEIIAVRNCYNNLLFFIDSLEQPLKRTPAEIEAAMREVEEKSKLFTEAHKEDVVSNDTPKVVSNDLEEASINYAATGLFLPNGKEMIDFQVEKAFKAGAQWQEEQIIKKACEFLKSHRQDTPDGTGYISGIINDETIEEFKQAMEE